jgi:hypothetical protein
MLMEVHGTIEIATTKPDRNGRERLLLGYRCDPQPPDTKPDALVWHSYGLEDARGRAGAASWVRGHGLPCDPDALSPETLPGVLRALRRAPPVRLTLEHQVWSNGRGSSWVVTGRAHTPDEARALNARLKALAPWKGGELPTVSRVSLVPDDPPF